MERVRRTTGGTYALTRRTVDEDGSPVTVATPQVKIYDGAGVQVGTTGTPTASAGWLAYTVPAGVMVELDTYEAVWTGTVSTAAVEYRQPLELVGGFLFEVEDLRSFDPAFADAGRYPGALIRAARTAAEMRFERACRVAFVPRGRRARQIGDGTYRLEVADNALRELLGGSIGTDALTSDEIDEITVREWGAIDRPAGKVWTLGELVQVHYEHGWDYPTPEIAQAVMLVARDYLVRSPLSSRATVEATDVGFFRLSVAGPDRPFGIPEVDAVIRAVGRNRPTIG